MSATDLIIDFSNPREKALLLDKVRGLISGMWRVTIKRYHKRRTDLQNRYYHPCFVAPFADFLRAQGHGVSDDDAHEILKHQFLRRSIVDEKSGLMLELTKSTTELSTVEFNTYLDQCASFLLDFAGIVVPEPSIYREKPDD